MGILAKYHKSVDRFIPGENLLLEKIHNLKAVSSNLAPATNKKPARNLSGFFILPTVPRYKAIKQGILSRGRWGINLSAL